MGYSQADKAANRERILDEAARQIRETGLDSVSVGSLMRSVNLTHGGFYGHFESRSDLVTQALRRALEESERSARSSRDPDKPLNFRTLVRGYLSPAHRDARDRGCAVAALASEVVRADPQAREVMSEHIDRFFATVAASLRDSVGDEDEAEAMFATAALVGALMLSRAMVDPKRADALLSAVRARLVARGAGAASS